jgi:tetratricopeptide (TPR) repeat protein
MREAKREAASPGREADTLAWPSFALVLIAAVGAHLPSAAFPFVFDDEWLVVRNAFLREPWALATAFVRHFWYGTPFGAGYYRPLVVESLVIGGRLLGWGPVGFHLFNIACHATTSALLLRLFGRLGVPARAAAFGALLFALHPATAWPVGSIVARVDLLPGLFLVLAFTGLASGSPLLTTGAFFLALLSKEAAIAFVGVPWLALRAPLLPKARRAALATALAVTAAVPVYLVLRLAAGVSLGLRNLDIDPVTNPLAQMAGADRLRAALALSGRYLSYLFVPWRLTDPAAYGPGAAGPDWMAPRVLCGLLIAALWIATGVVLWLRRDRIGVFLAFGLAAFLPSSNLIQPIGSLYAQNFLYLPLLGLALACGDAAGRLERRATASTAPPGGVRRMAEPVAVAFLLLLGAATFLEERIWRSPVALFEAWSRRYPNYSLGWSRLGTSRLQAGDAQGAVPALERALVLDEGNGEAHYNLGLALLQAPEQDGPIPEDRLRAALAHEERAAALLPAVIEPRINAGRLLLMLGRPAEAETEARAALTLAPEVVAAGRLLADSLYLQGHRREALEEYRRLASEVPADPELRATFVGILVELGDLEAARAAAEAGRRDFRGLPVFDVLLARVEARSGHEAEARALLRAAHDRDPAVEDVVRAVHDFDAMIREGGLPWTGTTSH